MDQTPYVADVAVPIKKENKGIKKIAIVLVVVILIFSGVLIGVLLSKSLTKLPVQENNTSNTDSSENFASSPVDSNESANNKIPEIKYKTCTLLKAGITISIPETWDCITNGDVNKYDSNFGFAAKSNTDEEISVSFGNLGRGPYCGGGPSDDSCKRTEFFKNEFIKVEEFYIQGMGREYLGLLPSTSKLGGYVTVNYKNSGVIELNAEEISIVKNILDSITFGERLGNFCKNDRSGIAINIPDSWTCVNTSTTETVDKNAITFSFSSNDSRKFEVLVSNLGRGSLCLSGGDESNPQAGCTITDFYSNELVTLREWDNSDGAREIAGPIKDIGYAFINFDNDNTPFTELETQTLIQMFETLRIQK